MRSARIAIPAAIALFAFAACDNPADVPFDDVAVTQDVAAASGDAAANMVEIMVGNETAAGGGAEIGGAQAAPTTDFSVSRTRTCQDAAGATVQNCLPFSSVRKIITAATISGSRSSTRTNASGATVTWTGIVHRSSNDTTSRVFSGATETSRVHAGNGIAHDTTTFTDGVFIRKLSETALDSVKALTFNLPRSSNPYPVSGSIVRRSAATVAITKADKSVSRDLTHRVEVLFPADAQGNVTLKIDAKTCQLNLVTHAVTNC